MNLATPLTGTVPEDSGIPEESGARDIANHRVLGALPMAYPLLGERDRSSDVSMLRIQRSLQDGVVRLTLSGRIDGEHLPELRRSIEGEDRQRGLTLDLEEVRLVDQDAVRFLARCEAAGARLEGCAPYVREWITTEGTRRKRPRGRSSRSRIDRRGEK